jgi:hypothetical protein
MLEYQAEDGDPRFVRERLEELSEFPHGGASFPSTVRA